MGVDWALALRKLGALALFAAAAALSATVSARMADYSERMGEEVCVRDTLRFALDDWLRPLTGKLYVRNGLMVVDALLIDLFIGAVGLVWVLTGRSLSWLFALVPFYAFRAAALSISKWPMPEPYLFADPGFPSFFVGYARTNDLYFSGHTGMGVAMLVDAWLNGRTVLFLVANAMVLITVLMLFALNGHFVNDIIVGLLAGATAAMLAFKYRFDLTLLVLRALAAAEGGAAKALKFVKRSG